MEINAYHHNETQFDYFSENYQRFQDDFYRYSNLKIPLAFLEDELLRMMSASTINYFRIPKRHSLDHRDHTFVFNVRTDARNRLIRIYHYQYHYFD
ncbi:DUF5960 family protein [Facklamia miroungae]|uniref:Uncharacterized protein n=1 Tax=Facklamia miroungae TaxID=120956 RepID=A0A1G7TX50_9LACT|nr:DUF5960 family protein [Facklamia miroungae]NKZ30008.1 hypothetical protein [Facklamia miroungae]SDG39808.1 hypothetical protein SAMN05421791_10775 [Facklamia miroungae]